MIGVDFSGTILSDLGYNEGILSLLETYETGVYTFDLSRIRWNNSSVSR